ncbi:alpha/beta hydrolase [Paenibacillus sp. GCM10023252]|uniref:alpha/beta hydrolase n=1 Tax=Paenibacillus sp. GCM10023252 TaxID=3252649 RepID=UPI003611727F
MMDHTEWRFDGSDGTRLYIQEWLPHNQPSRGVVGIIHGMGEHSGRYQPVADRLTAAGYAVLAYDQRGHGLSPGKRGHTFPMAAVTGDADAFLRHVIDRHPLLPRFLYGHSMGGNVALNYALRYEPDIAGLVLTSPWLRLAFEPPAIRVWAGKQIARVWPSFSQSTRLKSSDLYQSPPVNPEKLADGLRHERITVGTYIALHAAGEWAMSNIDRLQSPLLLMHGTGDRVTSYECSGLVAEALADRCTFRKWDVSDHEVHNGNNRDEFLQAIVEWLDHRVRT